MTPTQLRAAREELGFTQKKLAERMGLRSGQIISNKESGHSAITGRDAAFMEMLMKDHRTVQFPPNADSHADED